VLIVDHSDDGALGVILNRRTDSPIAENLPSLASFFPAGACFYEGGPVEHDSVIILGKNAGEWVMCSSIDLLSVDPATLRAFVGYAGWSRLQIDNEVWGGSWILADVEDSDFDEEQAEGLWRRVLARQPEPIRRLARYPDELIAN
jgi:putative transcriptional regulator